MNMSNLKKKTVVISLSLFIIGLIYIGILQYKIFQFNHTTVPKNADYLIVLGARVKRTVPSLVLKERINTAAAYLQANKNTVVIASGGKGPGEDISEAENIKNELMKKGIGNTRIILEDQSTDTYENIRFSKRLIPKGGKKGVVVTNTFHLYRAIMIAKDQNLNVYGVPAKTPKSAILKSYIREYLAITKYYIKSLLS
jgi:uncharacterized SAM-binding protein YcdF (DUF218 family)